MMRSRRDTACSHSGESPSRVGRSTHCGDVTGGLRSSRTAWVIRPRQSSSRGAGRRLRLVLLRRRLSSSRRSTAPRVGFVARRGGPGGARAPRTIAARRRRAAARLRTCSRLAWACTTSSPRVVSRAPSRSRRRLRIASSSAALEVTFQTRLTRVATLFTRCPPGPPERLTRSTSSRAGITSPRSTRRSPRSPAPPLTLLDPARSPSAIASRTLPGAGEFAARPAETAASASRATEICARTANRGLSSGAVR